MLNGLDLFSGIGGISIALRQWVKPVAYCEIDTYAAGVLFSRMLDGSIPCAPVFPDVTKLTGKVLPSVDIIYGGFPCQDVSLAGLRRGLEGCRTGLFAQVVRLTDELRPSFVFLENVPGIKKFVPRVRAEFEAIGYECRDGFLSAAEVGAEHIRNRWWFLAHSKRESEGRRPATKRTYAQPTRRGWFWETQPNVDRVVDGIPRRMDRIKCLGNSVVPQCAEEAFERLMGL